MATRTIVEIDEVLCDGCALCIPSCVEGALKIIDGKAVLVSDIYCDGLGNCLGDCPQDAIKMVERDADDYDEEAVEQHLENLAQEAEKENRPAASHHHGGGCPSSQAKTLAPVEAAPVAEISAVSQLQNWPVQLGLLHPQAPYLKDANLLLCADCVPFALPDFHSTFLKDKVCTIACPKLDNVQPYLPKLATIFASNNLRSLTILLMEVPCCSGLASIAKQAMEMAGVSIPIRTVIVGVRGNIIADNTY